MSISLTLPQAPAARSSIWQRQIHPGRKLRLKERQQLYQQWSILLRAGLGIIDCLDILIGQAAAPHIKAMLQSLRHSLESGKSLADSLAAQQSYFDAFEQQSVRIGEQTGRLALVLEQLAAFYEKRLRLKRKMMQALSYPIVVILIAMGVMAFMLGMVVPMFEDVFSRFDASLPAITQLIMDASTFFRRHVLVLFLGSVSILGLGVFLGKKEGIRLRLSKLILRIPLIGKMLLLLHMARFAAALAMLMEARVPLDRSLLLVIEMLRFAPLKACLPAVRQAVVEGETLFEAVSREKLFPMTFTQMIQVGEKTARLDEMLAHYAKVTEEAAENKLNQLTQLLEPLLILTLGGMVAVILVAMYLPMFELSSVMG